VILTETVRFRPWPRRLAAGSAVVVITLGVTVLAGWFFLRTEVIQLSTHLPPMTRNAAACLVLCGLAVLLQSVGRARWLVLVCAGTAATISALTTVEY